MAVGAGILEDRPEDLARLQRIDRALHDADAQRRRPRLDHRDGLRVQVMGHEERICPGFCLPPRHGHRLGRRRRLVQQRGIGHRQPGQVRHHRLVVQQRLQPALRDLGLIGGVGRVPGRVLQDVPLDRRGRDGAVVTLPDERGHHPVLRGHLLHPRQQPGLGQGRPVQPVRLPDCRRHGLLDQLIEAVGAHSLQHLLHLGRRGADMAPVGEIVGVVVGRVPAAHHASIGARCPSSSLSKYPGGPGVKPPAPAGPARPGRPFMAGPARLSRSAPCRRPRPGTRPSRPPRPASAGRTRPPSGRRSHRPAHRPGRCSLP